MVVGFLQPLKIQRRVCLDAKCHCLPQRVESKIVATIASVAIHGIMSSHRDSKSNFGRLSDGKGETSVEQKKVSNAVQDQTWSGGTELVVTG